MYIIEFLIMRLGLSFCVSFSLFSANILLTFWAMTNLMHPFLMYLFYASTCFEQQVLIIRRARQTVTHQSVIPDDVLIQFSPPDVEHLLLETC
jgi:hypothetical protein